MNDHSRSIDIRHHAIRQDYVNGEMRIGGVATHENTSDILTKNLQPPLHIKHTRELHLNPENPSHRQTLSNNVLSMVPRRHEKHREAMPELPPAFGDLIFRPNQTQRNLQPLPHPTATCAHLVHKNVEKPPKNTQHRRRAKTPRKIRQTTGSQTHTKQNKTRRTTRSANRSQAPPYTSQDNTLPHRSQHPPQQAQKQNNEKQKGAGRTRANQMQTGKRRRNFLIFDNIKNEIKFRHKRQRFEKILTSTKEHTKRHTIFKRLFCQLETLLQNHIEFELNSRHNGYQIFVQNQNFENHTKTKFLKSKNTWNNKKKSSNFAAITTRNSATNRSIIANLHLLRLHNATRTL